jgi:hypothetical protein
VINRCEFLHRGVVEALRQGRALFHQMNHSCGVGDGWRTFAQQVRASNSKFATSGTSIRRPVGESTKRPEWVPRSLSMAGCLLGELDAGRKTKLGIDVGEVGFDGAW